MVGKAESSFSPWFWRRGLEIGLHQVSSQDDTHGLHNAKELYALEAPHNAGQSVGDVAALVQKASDLGVGGEGHGAAAHQRVEPLLDQPPGQVGRRVDEGIEFTCLVPRLAVEIVADEAKEAVIHCSVTESCWSERDTEKWAKIFSGPMVVSISFQTAISSLLNIKQGCT